MNLRGGELGLREIHLAVDAGIEAVGDDGDELLGAGQLLVERLLAGEVAVERKVGDDGVLLDDGAGVVEVEHSSLQAEPRGADVVPLCPAEERALQSGVDDRRFAQRIAVGEAEARANGDRRDVDVLALLQDGSGLVDVGLGEANAWVVLEGEIDGGDERDLGVRRLEGRDEREGSRGSGAPPR